MCAVQSQQVTQEPSGRGLAGELVLMNALHLTGTPTGARSPERLAEGEAAPRHEHRTIDGVRWLVRPEWAASLEAVDAARWRTPGAQPGWERIKQNDAREVWRARCGAESFYLKYYFRDGWRNRLKAWLRAPLGAAEWEAGLYALGHGIPAAYPAGLAPDVPGYRRPAALLVSPAIEPAYPLNEFWSVVQRDNEGARRRSDTVRLIELLAEMIARAHQAGFEHTDMHAANILVQSVNPNQYRTLFVDLHGAKLGRPVEDRAVVRNLAQLNQWFRRHSSIGDRLRFLRAYFRWRNEYEQAFTHARPLGLTFETLVRALIDEADIHARRLWAQRDRRMRKSGRYFQQLKLPGGWRGVVATNCKHAPPCSDPQALTLPKRWWRAALTDTDSLLAQLSAANEKDSHSAQVARVRLDDGKRAVAAIAKRPLARNRRRWWRQLLPPSRSGRAFLTGHALLHRDQPAARPLAYLERRIGPLVADSVLLTEQLEGALDLGAYVETEYARRSTRLWRQCKNRLIEDLATLLRRFQARGFSHRDCKAQNILVVQRAQRHLVWIDMDGIRLGGARRRCELAMLARLYVSLAEHPGVSRTDAARLLKAYYRRFGNRTDTWRTAWRQIARRIDRKRERLARRRQWKRRVYGRI